MAFRDVVILLPGITGSTLEKDGRVIWGADLGGVLRAITSGGDAIRELALNNGDDPSQDDIDGVVATSLIPDLHLIPGLWKIDGYTKVRRELLRRLELTEAKNFFEFPYDWRRDNRVSGRKLAVFARDKLARWRESSGAADAKLVLVTHSMGGLVARSFIDSQEGWRDTRALITLGTPHRGSLNALGYLANGLAKKVGPLKLDLSEVARTFTGLYQLLPTFKCIDTGGPARARVRELNNIPNIDHPRAEAAAVFYDELENHYLENLKLQEYQDNEPLLFPIIGTFQSTKLSARLSGGALSLLTTSDGKDDSGDGTVPRISALPKRFDHSPAGLAVGMYAEQVHGSLQNDDVILTQIAAIVEGLSIDRAKYRAGQVKVGLDLDDVYGSDQPVTLRAKVSEPISDLFCDIYDARTSAAVDGAARLTVVALRKGSGGQFTAETVLPPGAYRARVRGKANVMPATDCFLVIDPRQGTL